MPYLRKYVRVEDTCAQCSKHPSHAPAHIMIPNKLSDKLGKKKTSRRHLDGPVSRRGQSSGGMRESTDAAAGG